MARISLKDLENIVSSVNNQRKENIKFFATLDSILIWYDDKEIEFVGSNKNRKAWDYLQSL